MTVKQLEKKAELLRKQLQSVNVQIEKMHLPKKLAELKKKYLGKCFIYMNSYGSSIEPWPLYSRVIAVEDDLRFFTEQFQTPSEIGPKEYKVGYDSVSLFQSEISSDEYHAAKDQFFMSIVSEMLQKIQIKP